MGRVWPAMSLLVLTLAPAAPAQTPPVPNDLATTLSRAQQALAERDAAAASSLFQDVLERAREQHDERSEGWSLNGLATIAYRGAQYRESRDLNLKALEIFERLEDWKAVGFVERALGNATLYLTQPDEAARWYHQAMEAAARAGDTYGHAAATYDLVHSDGSSRQLERYPGLIAEVRGLNDRLFEAQVLHSWGDHLFNAGEYENAIEKVEQAATLYEALGQKDELSTAYNSIGRIFRAHGQPAAALQYQLKALAIQKTLDNPRNRIQSLNAVAVTYQSLGDWARARAHYASAIALAERIGWTQIVPRLRGNLGEFLADTGDLVRGRRMLEQSLDDQVSPSTRRLQLSGIDFLLGRYREALTFAEQSLDACRKEGPPICIDARVRRAEAELALGRRDAAREDSAAALAALEEMHGTLAASDFLKQGFAALRTPTYTLAIDIRFQTGDVAGALDAAEAGRARALMDLMATREAGLKPRDPLATLTWRGSGQSDAVPLASDPIAVPSTIHDLVQTARDARTTLLLYWVGWNRLYIWVVGADGRVHGADVNVRASRLEELVRSVAPSSGAENADDDWRELYADLIHPIEAYLPRDTGARITIVPHGPLLGLPFPALPDAQNRYLIERYTIASVPSVALLQFTRAHHHENARRGSMLLVADPSSPPVIPGEPPLPRLPGAVEETHAIARLVPASRRTLLTGPNATEAQVVAAAEHRTVVHFATHAIVRDTDPLSSFLALDTGRGSTDDGRLTPRKIYGLKLDADLVVLSACRSGGGLVTGDGIAGLARAFFYAGASSVIVSVWDVADEPAQRLMPAFYKAWLAGADKATALRDAQLQLIASLRSGTITVRTPAGDVPLVESPALWAGFVLIGNSD